MWMLIRQVLLSPELAPVDFAHEPHVLHALLNRSLHFLRAELRVVQPNIECTEVRAWRPGYDPVRVACVEETKGFVLMTLLPLVPILPVAHVGLEVNDSEPLSVQIPARMHSIMCDMATAIELVHGHVRLLVR